MSGVTIDYKGSTIATIPDTGTKTLKTQGKYCEGDIEIDYVAPSAPQPVLEHGSATPKAIADTYYPQGDGFSDFTVNATPLESKTVPASTQQITYTPTAPNIGFSSFTVEEIPESAKNVNFDAFMNNTLTEVNTTANTLPNYAFSSKTAIININATNATSIGESACAGCSNLTSINAPNITSYGRQALENCTNLESITWNDNITNFNNFATFLNCRKLVFQNFPSALITIGTSVFMGCVALKNIVLPSHLSSMGGNAFAYCAGLLTVDCTLLEQIPSIESSSFIGTTCIFLFRDQTQLDAYAAATNWSALASRFQIKPSGV